MTARRRWTNEEEQVLISQVKQSPNNLARAFRATSEIVGRSFKCVEVHWYTKTRHSGTIFMTIGSNTRNINSKNVRENTTDNTESVQLPIWRRILKLLGL